MRLPELLSVAVAAGVVGSFVPSVSAQEVKHWPLAKISFPIDLTAFNQLDPKPASIRFYAAPPKGQFKLVANRKPDDLDAIVDTSDPAATPRRGFTYTSAADGDEEFAVQYEYADGTLAPPTSKLVPQFRIRFDTRPPGVKAVATGGNSIRWQVEDENLITDSVRIEGRYPGETQWQFLNTGDLRAEDSFDWKIPPGKTLEVRVYARDRAGHENRSLPIRLTGDDRPSAPPPPGGFGDPVKAPAPVDRTGTGYGGLDDLPANRPRIEYVSTNKLRVSSKITHVTRSGVKAAQLYVLEPTNGADWRAAGKNDRLAITPDSPDSERVVSIEYEAPRDGLYGFILQPISGAGTKLDDPRAGDTPQYLVEVDTTKPEMEFNNVKVTGSGLNGPLVEIEWTATDKNLTPEPIVLEYSEDQKTWKPIAGKAPNTGRYTWEITDKRLWKFWVRGSASDMAGNTTLVDYTDGKDGPTPVLVDLDKPSGAVDKVNPNGPPRATPLPPIGGGGGVSGVSGVSAQPPEKLPIRPVGETNPKPVTPVTPPEKTPLPPIDGPPVPDLTPKPADKPMTTPKPPVEAPKPDPKKDDKKEAPGLTLPPIVPPPATEPPPATVPLPSLPPIEKK